MLHTSHSPVRILVALFVLALTVLALYANTFKSPFAFDDSQIFENYFITQSDLSWESLKNIYYLSPNKRRVLPNLSFGFNYFFGGTNVFGYHLVNIIIHIGVSLVFYLLARTTLALPGPAKDFNRSAEIAFAATLLWAIHPLQTNGVTYIVQRMTSMATLFFLLSLLCYVKARIHARVDFKKILLGGASALFGVLALLSKEISAMLPVMILGYEFFFLRQARKSSKDRKKLFLMLGGGLLLFAAICLLFLGSNPIAGILNKFNYREFTLSQRLLTETRVIFHYLALLVLPLPSRLNLAYDYPLSTGLIAPPQTLLAIIGLIGLTWLVFALYKRDRLASFAIFWFLGNLLIESSVIALEIIFEHRMYMPSMFLFLAGVAWCYRLLPDRVNTARIAILALAILLAFNTWQRNSTWKNQITLWTDVISKAPASLRGHTNLGIAYGEAQKYDLAEIYLRKAVGLGQIERSGNFSPAVRKKFLAKAHDGLGMMYRELKNYPQAIQEANLALALDPARPGPLVTLGIVYAKMAQHQKAYGYFTEAAARGLNSVDLYNNWAVSSFSLGMVDKAITLLKHALVIDPAHPESHYNLGIAYSSKGMLEEARYEMNMSMQLRKEILLQNQKRY